MLPVAPGGPSVKLCCLPLASRFQGRNGGDESVKESIVCLKSKGNWAAWLLLIVQCWGAPSGGHYMHTHMDMHTFALTQPCPPPCMCVGQRRLPEDCPLPHHCAVHGAAVWVAGGAVGPGDLGRCRRGGLPCPGGCPHPHPRVSAQEHLCVYVCVCVCVCECCGWACEHVCVRMYVVKKYMCMSVCAVYLQACVAPCDQTSMCKGSGAVYMCMRERVRVCKYACA